MYNYSDNYNTLHNNSINLEDDKNYLIKNEHHTNNTNKKITINIGGKKFCLKKSFLEYLNIDYNKLNKIIKNDNIIYFMDKDPHYFSKIIEIIKTFGNNENEIIKNLENFSEQLVSELCFYGILDKKFNPTPKLKLKKFVYFNNNDNDSIIKIVIGEQIFETLNSTLSKSLLFDTKLKHSKNKEFKIIDIDPKIFRYVLNFLRSGFIYINNLEILEILDAYGIEYEKIETKKIFENIVSCYTVNNLYAIKNQINSNKILLDSLKFSNNNNNDFINFMITNIIIPLIIY